MVVAGVGGAAARRGERAITARVEDSSNFETPSRGSSTASAVLSSVCLSVCLPGGGDGTFAEAAIAACAQ